MAELVISLFKSIMGFAFIGAPVICLIALLHAQDHRKSIIEGIVGKELNYPELRGLVAVNTRYALLSKRCTAELDMPACSNEQIWDVIGRLRGNLPSSVRLVVNGVPARSPRTAFSLEIRSVRRVSLTSNFAQ